MTNPVSLAGTGPDLITRAEGVYLYTNDGRKILDIGSGLANVNIGYGNPRLCDVAAQTMRQLSFGHTLYGRSNPWAAALSAKLTEITPEQFQYFFFASTGSDAIESSIKLALRYWRLLGKPAKRAVMGRLGSYHGNTLFAASLTGIESFHTQFGLPVSDMIHHARSTSWFRDGKGLTQDEFCSQVIQALEAQVAAIGPENIAAFVGEPLQGSVIPPPDYWPQVRRICDRNDILLIADEVISGFGKTGLMFGFQNFAYEPDLMVMAKGLSSGYFPISAVGVGARVSEAVRNADEIFAHVFTNCGHPVGAAVALENIAFIEEHRLVERVREDIGPYFRSRLSELQELPCVGETRAFGVLGGIEMQLTQNGQPASQAQNDALLEKVVDIAWKRGVATKGGGLCLPMIITRQQIDDAIAILKDSIVEAMQ